MKVFQTQRKEDKEKLKERALENLKKQEHEKEMNWIKK